MKSEKALERGTGMTQNQYREKIRGMYDFIKENLYFNRPDLEIKGEKFNSALIFSLLTGLNRGKELIIGEPGLGKTTSAEYVGSLLYRIPIGVIWGAEVSGHPEQTEEKIIGRPDLGKLNRGKEEVVWSNFAQIPVKIVDEINRLPETKQSMILDGVDRGNWEYLNEMIINEEYCLFATANYQDRGTNTIIAPMVDRFDVEVESRHPGPNIAYLVGKFDQKDRILRNPRAENSLQKILTSKLSYQTKIRQMEEVFDSYGGFLKRKLSVETVGLQERKAIRAEIARLELDLDANAFTRMLLAELSFCYKYGQKRSVENCEEGCHFTGYLCHDIRNCASNRLPTSIKSYSQALAWLIGDAEVDVEHIKAVTPYTLTHRIQWKEEYLSTKEKDKRDNPFQVYLAKEAVKAVFNRYGEQNEHLKNALAVGYRVFNGEALEPVDGDHPVYFEIKKDLGVED
jgi:MoxR-like ATPase